MLQSGTFLSAVLVMILYFDHGYSLNVLWNGFNTSLATNTSILPKVELYEQEFINFTFNCSLSHLSEQDILSVTFQSKDPDVASLLDVNNKTVAFLQIPCHNETVDVFFHGGHLGITTFSINLDGNNNISITDVSVNTLRRVTLFDELAVLTIGPLILINKCAFGAKIDVEVLRQVVTQPVELILCLVTQFVLMPVTAVLLGGVFKLDQIIALALLVSAACPGGGGGYVFSYLIEGDITLAITASLVSTLVAMIAMPGVIGIYSAFAHIPNSVVIPYVKILLMLLAIATPISLGMLLRNKRPLWAKKLITIIKPLSLFLIFAGLVVVLVTSRYIMYGPKIGYLIAIIIPLTGFCQGILLSKGTCRNWPLTKAVALESGLKNTVLGVAVIELSFPQPQADLASILIVMITVGQVVVAMAWYFAFLLKRTFTENYWKKQDIIELDPLEAESFLNHE